MVHLTDPSHHIHEHGGEFVLPVKENRQALFDALDALPWGQVPIARTATDKGHGRITTRTIQVLPAPDNLPFPHVRQVFLIERNVTDLAGKPVSAVAALGVASPEPGQADPRRPGRLRPGAVVDRVFALDPRHALPGRHPARAAASMVLPALLLAVHDEGPTLLGLRAMAAPVGMGASFCHERST
jgi:hypothetical protein